MSNVLRGSCAAAATAVADVVASIASIPSTHFCLGVRLVHSLSQPWADHHNRLGVYCRFFLVLPAMSAGIAPGEAPEYAT